MKIRTHFWDGLILLLVAAFLILPLALTFFYSIFTEWMDVLPSGFTLQFYAGIFSDGAFINSLLRSIVISAFPVFLCTASILLVLYVMTLYFPKYLASFLIFNSFINVLKKMHQESIDKRDIPKHSPSGQYTIIQSTHFHIFVDIRQKQRKRHYGKWRENEQYGI